VCLQYAYGTPAPAGMSMQEKRRLNKEINKSDNIDDNDNKYKCIQENFDKRDNL
jgi:hypothetical protein